MKRKHKSRGYTIAESLGIAIAIIVIGAISCMGLLLFSITNPHMRCFGTLIPSRSHVEELARITLPDSATNFTYHLVERGALAAPECRIWIQFEMIPEDLEAFRQSAMSIDFYYPNVDSSGIRYSVERVNWSLPPDSIVTYARTPCCSPEIQQWILIDTDNTDSWIVHVITNEYWLD